MLRYMSRKNEDLYVLEEHGSKNWEIKFFPHGFSEIEKKTLDYFGSNLGKNIRFPMNHEGLDNYILRHLILEQNISVRMAEENEMTEFYNTFIENIYLKSDLDLPWESFVRCRNGFPSNYALTQTREKSERLILLIKTAPSLIGIPATTGVFFEEVALSNQFSKMFNSFKEFSEYQEHNEEPTSNLKSGITRIDLVYITSNRSYLIELKTRRRKKDNSQDKDCFKQLSLAGHFMEHNFSTSSVLLSAIFHYTNDKERLRYRRYQFNPETKMLVLGQDSGW